MSRFGFGKKKEEKRHPLALAVAAVQQMKSMKSQTIVVLKQKTVFAVSRS